MKTSSLVFSILLALTSASQAATFMLSGTVPDRGYSMKGQNIKMQEGTGLKVFVSDHKPSRGPASVDSNFSNSKNWKKLAGPAKLAKSTCIRVEAP